MENVVWYFKLVKWGVAAVLLISKISKRQSCFEDILQFLLVTLDLFLEEYFISHFEVIPPFLFQLQILLIRIRSRILFFLDRF
jgi:hypothetical protein